MEKQYYVYILMSGNKNVLYTGVTNDLVRRIWGHREELVDGFSKKYKTKKLVYYEIYQDIKNAISREKRIKKWDRSWKTRLIQKMNPGWKDLYEEIIK